MQQPNIFKQMKKQTMEKQINKKLKFNITQNNFKITKHKKKQHDKTKHVTNETIETTKCNK